MRRNIIDHQRRTEHIILKSRPCFHGKCVFCRFTKDNTTDQELIRRINREVISQISGCYQRLEVYNSGSICELPWQDLRLLQRRIRTLGLRLVITEAHWHYRHLFTRLRRLFQPARVCIKVGVETFDTQIREAGMRKNMGVVTPAQVAAYTDSINLLVGFQGQTRGLIKRDLQWARSYFSHVDVNLLDATITPPALVDQPLLQWFREEQVPQLRQDPRFRIFFRVQDCDATSSANH